MTVTQHETPQLFSDLLLGWVEGHGKPSCIECILSLHHSRATWACLLEAVRGRPDRGSWAVGPPSRPRRGPASPWVVQELAGKGTPLAQRCCDHMLL